LNGRHSISIAVLTENQDDVELINGALRDAGHAAHCHWIASSNRLADTLAAEDVELLILYCDRYADSIRQVVKQKDRYNPEVPVIALQKQAEEEDIDAAMRSGACDLVSVGNKKRLQSVVSRELRALRVERALNSTLQSATEYKKHLKHHMASQQLCIDSGRHLYRRQRRLVGAIQDWRQRRVARASCYGLLRAGKPGRVQGCAGRDYRGQVAKG
jgi:DNA-binding NtrC family response regulator